MDSVYGKQSTALGDAKRQMITFVATDPSRMRIAHMAWPHFSKHRLLIDKRDTDAFFKYDLAGLQAKGKLDVKTLWSKASVNSREALWNAVEDFLDLLDTINEIRPIPVDDDDNDVDTVNQKKNYNGQVTDRTWFQTLDDLVPVASLPPTVEDDLEEEEDDDVKDQKSAKSAPGAGGGGAPAEWTKHLMSNLKDMIGGDDPSVDEDFEQLMTKLNEPEDGKTTAQDQETMTRILHHFIEKISPMASGEDDDMENMSEQEKKSETARRKIQEIQLKNQLKFAIGKLTSIESLQQTSDPTILENDKREQLAEQERMKNPNQNREYTITAHFNHKLLLFLNKLHTVRGTLKSKKDGRIIFPGIKSSFAQLLTIFKENPGTEAVIRPVGEWVVAHRTQLLNRDDKLFLEPDHAFLQEVGSSALWQTFKPHERVNFWSLVGHPLQLATIFHHLDNDNLRDIADIVNDLLAAGKIAYDRDPNTLNGKQVITKAIERGCTQHKIGKIRGLFERMQKEPDQRTLKSLAKLMQDVLPQAAGLRNGKSHNDDDPESDGAAQVKASRDRADQMQATFAKILAGMPTLPSLINPNDVKQSDYKADGHIDVKPNPPSHSAPLTTSATSATSAPSATAASAPVGMRVVSMADASDITPPSSSSSS